MNSTRRNELIVRFLEAWNSQDVDRVLDCYTDDVRYRDPNTRGDVLGRDAMRRYLSKLFAAWQMTWAAREVYEIAGDDGAAFLWHATFRRAGQPSIVEIDGMDLALLRGDRVARNDVYFDKTALG
jgi:ketosteroid isomerase-like protein